MRSLQSKVAFCKTWEYLRRFNYASVPCSINNLKKSVLTGENIRESKKRAIYNSFASRVLVLLPLRIMLRWRNSNVPFYVILPYTHRKIFPSRLNILDMWLKYKNAWRIYKWDQEEMVRLDGENWSESLSVWVQGNRSVSVAIEVFVSQSISEISARSESWELSPDAIQKLARHNCKVHPSKRARVLIWDHSLPVC